MGAYVRPAARRLPACSTARQAQAQVALRGGGWCHLWLGVTVTMTDAGVMISDTRVVLLFLPFTTTLVM